MYGAAKIRSWYAKPQSSSSQRLNAVNVCVIANDVVAEQLLVEDAERREQPDRLEPELVELGDAGVAVAVLGRDRLALAEELVAAASRRGCRGSSRASRRPWRSGSNVGLTTAWLTRPPTTWYLRPLISHHCTQRRPERRVEVAGEGVERLVVVVVGVEGEIIELGHAATVLRLRPPALGRPTISAVLLADIADAVDLDWSFVPEGRAQMAATGACEIPGFVRADALPAFVDDARRLASRRVPQRRARHRLPRLSRRVVPARPPAAVARPVRRRRGGLRPVPGRLADPPPLRVARAAPRFVAAILGLDEIYPYADPLGALNLAVMTDGDQLQWHFDQTDFVVSLAIQDADVGGDFESRAADPHRRRRALRRRGATCSPATRGRVVTLPMTPGHAAACSRAATRCTGSRPIAGTTPRLVALLGYDTKPGTMSSELLKEVRYGRVGVTAVMQIGEGFAGDGSERRARQHGARREGRAGRHGVGDRARDADGSGTRRSSWSSRPNVPVKPFTLFVNKAAIDGDKNEHARAHVGRRAGRRRGGRRSPRVRKGVVSESRPTTCC